jgi:hypothetical protein
LSPLHAQLVIPAPPLVIPAKAGIQYAETPAINPIGRGVLGRPVKPGDDSGVCGVSVIRITLPAAA